jgi:transcription elongation factor GreA
LTTKRKYTIIGKATLRKDTTLLSPETQKPVGLANRGNSHDDKRSLKIMAKKQISKSGAAKLREELDFLVTVRRAEMAQKLKEARAQGDLSENAEYDEAKNEQAILEAQIAEIQYTLDNSEEVDDDSISVDEVGLGSTVKLKNFRTGKIETFQIVSSNEANFAEAKISDESPIGKGALKKKVGDTFLIEAPAGELKFEILEISK